MYINTADTRLRKASFGQGRNAEVLKLVVGLDDALVGEDELDRGRPPQPDPGLGDLVPVAGGQAPGAFQQDVVAGALQDDAVAGVFDSLPSRVSAIKSGIVTLFRNSYVPAFQGFFRLRNKRWVTMLLLLLYG